VLIRAGLLLWALTAAQTVAATIPCVAVWRDSVRDRDVPVRIYLPSVSARVPLVIWSPGMGATTAGGQVWAQAWAAAGLAVIAVQHPGSDAAAAAPGPDQADRRLFATSGLHMAQRAGDIGFVMDELARRPREGACDLARIDQDRIGIAGHSLGAWTVQALAGQRFGGERGLIDRRPRAFIALSGSQLEPGDPTAIFGGIGRPYLVITGTRDGGEDNAAFNRTAIWRGLPADGRKYLALFGEATHMMFAGNRPAATPLGRRVEADVIRLSIAFWRRWLLEEPAADATLANPGLAPDDHWDRK